MDVDYLDVSTSSTGLPSLDAASGSFMLPTACVPRNLLGSPNLFPFPMDVDISDRVSLLDVEDDHSFSFAPEPEASGATVSLETAAPSTPQQPKHGRPPKKIKPTLSSSQTHHRLGRPPGSGPKQRAKAELLASGRNVSLPKKCPVGWPHKNKDMGGRVMVKLIQGKIQSLPDSSTGPRSSSAPLPSNLNTRSIFQFPVQRTCRASSVPSGHHPFSAQLGPLCHSAGASTPALSTFTSTTPYTSFTNLPPPPSTSSATMPFISHQIIPLEDPQCPVELEDKDDKNPEVSGDGLGDEDEFDVEGDEGDDERDPKEEDSGIQDVTGQCPRCLMPLWLRNAFKVKVTESAQRNENRLLPLYATHQSFWFPQPSMFFILQRKGVSPQHLYNPNAEICALDHSHKIMKHIAKVNGEEVFTALLTVTNQLGEIRSCNLVATKSHAQFEEALKQIQWSLELYGHILPYLFFTDNMADKQFLEHCFPSLSESVVPVEKYQNLEPLVVPDNVPIFIKKSKSAINDAMHTIIDDLPPDDSGAKIVIGFDSEWNVELSGNGNVIERGKTAIIQIAYKEQIYVLQIGDMVQYFTMPPHSMWIPHGMKILNGFHVDSIWNTF
ncbi:hypothetical protein M413DRAFT_25978 [Hebeloma cylindrosporum]|uniref:Uncharacterized protein n=1 Tax=Hebeloma cylindrosporum TaxID=76867 RepID=A0A0C3CHN7_HEBCY|nr:hypothetical protein M413DRAFT_25978 [Hebeloma cylindrosporum h7]